MTNRFENKLTKSAKEELEKYLVDERNRVLREAYSRASEIENDVDEISLRDVLEAIHQRDYKKQQLKRSDYRRRRMTMLLAMSGVLYSLIGILMYLYQNSKLDIENDFGLILAAVGILVTFMAFFYNQLYMLKGKRDQERSDKEGYSSESNFSIVERWSIIEKLTRDLIEKKNNEKPRSFGQILEYLRNDPSFSEKDQLELRKLLMLRNQILHESVNISNATKKEYLSLADEWIRKLEKERN